MDFLFIPFCTSKKTKGVGGISNHRVLFKIESKNEKDMMNSAYRQWEYEIMEEYLHSQDYSPIDHFYRDHLSICFEEQSLKSRANFIMVYLEDFKVTDKGTYDLLLDLFAFSDYTKFIEAFENERNDEKEEENETVRSTFFKIHNFQSWDTPIKDSHFILDIRGLKSLTPIVESGKSDGFPLLYNITLPKKEANQAGSVTFLYQTISLIYPQWIFSSLHQTNYPGGITSGIPVELRVWDVGQGNFNEVIVGNKPYVIFDAGTEVDDNSQSFVTYRQKLEQELNKVECPLFVLSHWHTDHYSLLFALNNSCLNRIKSYVFPSYVKSLSAFLFVAKLHFMGANVNMVVLPTNNTWVKQPINGNLILHANKYVSSSTNNSGLTLFVQGPLNNVMLPGDCRYVLAERQTNDAITMPMRGGQIHYLVVPHHGGLAGKVSYSVRNARVVEGIISVGANNKHKHPNSIVLSKIRPFLHGPIEMTMSKGDIVKGL